MRVAALSVTGVEGLTSAVMMLFGWVVWLPRTGDTVVMVVMVRNLVMSVTIVVRPFQRRRWRWSGLLEQMVVNPSAVVVVR